MVTNPHSVKTEIAQHVFCLLDHPQLLLSNRLAVGDARAETGHLWFVGRREAKFVGELADFGFGQAGLFQWGADLKFSGGLRSRTEISDVAGIFTVSDNREALFLRERSQLGKQFVFA